MTITVFSGIQKRTNSTRRPTGGTTINCVLKTPTSVNSPTFEVSISNFANAANINYVIWGTRYYYVSEVNRETNDIVSVVCRLDVLATYKSDITSSTQFVARSSTSYNLNISDTLNFPTKLWLHKTTQLSFNGLAFNSNGCYILTVAGTAGAYNTSSGFANAYALNASQMYTLVHELFTPDAVEAIVQEFTDPMSAIIGCIWLPVDSGQISGTTLPIVIGSYITGTSGKIVTNRYLSGTFETWNYELFPSNPPLYDYSGENYLQCSPYSSGTMYLPFVGVVPYDVDFYYKTQLTMRCQIDILTGDVMYSSGIRQTTYSGNCAAKCPVSADQTNYLGMLSSILSFTGNVIGTVLTTGASSGLGTLGRGIIAGSVAHSAPREAGALINSLGTHTQVNGALSSAMSVFPLGEGDKPTINIKVRAPAYPPTEIIDLFGGMLNRTVTLSSLGEGYVQCGGVCLSTIADYSERALLERYMENGIYIE